MWTFFTSGMQNISRFYFLKRQEKFVFYCLEEIHPHLLHNPGGNVEFVGLNGKGRLIQKKLNKIYEVRISKNQVEVDLKKKIKNV